MRSRAGSSSVSSVDATDCAALQLTKCLDERIEAAAFAGNAVPGLDEAGVGVGLDRLDLAPQHRQRTAAKLAEHI